MTFLTFLWLPVIQSSPQGLYIVAQNAMTHIAPPVSAIFLAALLWRRANGQGALAGLAVGTVFGGMRLILTIVRQGYCDNFVDPQSRAIVSSVQHSIVCALVVAVVLLFFILHDK